MCGIRKNYRQNGLLKTHLRSAFPARVKAPSGSINTYAYVGLLRLRTAVNPAFQMAPKSPWKTLTTRVTVSGIGLMLVAIGALSMHATRQQRADMEQQLGAQQYATATFIAANIDREFSLRIDALHKIAAPITPEQMNKPWELRRLMAERPVFQGMFNAGTFVIDPQGQVVATAADTIGGNASEVLTALPDSAQSPGPHSYVYLTDGAATEIRVAVPIRHNGQTIGALVGSNWLATPNFLDPIAKSSYGEAGAYVLYAPSQQRVVKASSAASPNRLLLHDASPSQLRSFFREQEGSYVTAGFQEQNLLISSKRITNADWLVSVVLPTAEAFAIVGTQQKRFWVFALAFAVILAGTAWWVLQRQFLPVRRTASALKMMAAPEHEQHALAFTGTQEIDTLIAGFNRLLSVLAERNSELQRSFSLNQNTLDSLVAQIAVVAESGQVLTVNKTWMHYLDHIGRNKPGSGHPMSDYTALFAVDVPCLGFRTATILTEVNAVLAGQHSYFSTEYAVRLPQGERWLSLSVTPLGGQNKGAVISRYDITEQKRSDERLRILSRAADQSPLAIVITDIHGNIEYTNPHFTDMTGYAPEDVQGRNPRMLKSGRTPGATYQSLWSALHAGKVWRGEFSNYRKNGELLLERAVIAPVLDPHGQVTHYVALKEDITHIRQEERRRASLSLRIEELSRRLVRVQEESRQRFSQELHDRTSPNLAALRINLDIIAKQLDAMSLDETMLNRIEDTRALIDDTTLSIREICAGLHPAAIERGGLLGVVRAYCEQIARRTGMRVDLRCPHEERRLSPELELALFRIVQEALTNCAKHANAASVEVRLQFDRPPVIVSIADDGQGFDAEATMRGVNLRGLGLVNMRDTVDFAGGRMRLESSPGAGTRIYIEI